jgi:hypothetical protein
MVNVILDGMRMDEDVVKTVLASLFGSNGHESQDYREQCGGTQRGKENHTGVWQWIEIVLLAARRQF